MEWARRFKEGVFLASDSFLMLWEHKVLLTYLLIPVVFNALVYILYIFGAMLLPTIVSTQNLSHGLGGWVAFWGSILLNWITIALLTFFHACVAHHTMRLLLEHDGHIVQTIKSCLHIWRPLLAWATIVTGVVLLLQIPGALGISLRIVVEKGLLARDALVIPFALIVLLASAVWSFATLVVIQCIVIERVTVRTAIALSVSVVKRRWVEIFGGQAWFGLIAALMAVPALIVAAFPFAYVTNAYQALLWFGMVGSIVGELINGVLSAAHVVFKTIVYYRYYKEPMYELEASDEIFF